MVDFIARRDGHKLVPATRFDLEALESIRPDRDGRVSFTFSRSVQRNRWYRGLVSVVAEGVDMHPDTLHVVLKFKAGLVEQILSAPEFGVAVRLHSTAFNTMDETRFAAYVDLAVEIIFRDYLPGVRRKDVFARVAELVGPRPPKPRMLAA